MTQSSGLVPAMFIVLINDLPEGIHSYINMFADDAKLLGREKHDCHVLQIDLVKISEWNNILQIELNMEKHHLIKCLLV